MNRESRCNTCGEPLLWAETSNRGKVPLDARPNPNGTLVLDQYGRVGPAADEPGTPDLGTRYTRHQCKER